MEAPFPNLVGNTRGSETLRNVQGRFSSLTLLGGDYDDAVRASGAVDRAGRRTLEHLNALNVIWVDVGGAVNALVLARAEVSARRLGDGVDTVGDRRVVDDDAVDHVKREEARVDRRDAAQLHLNTAADGAGVLGDDCTRDLALERIVDRLSRRPIELVSRNHGYRVGGIDAGDGRGCSGHDLRLELKDVASHRYVDFGVSGGDGHRLRDVTDAADAQRHRPVGSI